MTGGAQAFDRFRSDQFSTQKRIRFVMHFKTVAYLLETILASANSLTPCVQPDLLPSLGSQIIVVFVFRHALFMGMTQKPFARILYLW